METLVNENKDLQNLIEFEISDLRKDTDMINQDLKVNQESENEKSLCSKNFTIKENDNQYIDLKIQDSDEDEN